MGHMAIRELLLVQRAPFSFFFLVPVRVSSVRSMYMLCKAFPSECVEQRSFKPDVSYFALSSSCFSSIL